MKNNNYICICLFFYAVLLAMLPLNSAKTRYAGTVVPLIRSTLRSGTDFGFNGVLEHVARLGSIIKPQITDAEGNVLEKGTLLMLLNPVYWKKNVELQQSKVESSSAVLRTALENYKRAESLVKTQAISTKEYQKVRAVYYDALSDNSKKKAVLVEWQRVLDGCSVFSPFEGVIEKIYFAQGEASAQPQTIEISQLNPIGIKVKIPREESTKIKPNTLVKIYYQGSSIPLGISHGFSMLCDDGIIFKVANRPKYEIDTSINGKTILILRNCNSVIKFFIDRHSGTLAVPVDSIYQDNKGYYVWKAKKQKNMQSDKGISCTFPVEKSYIVPDNLQRMHGGFNRIRALKNPGTLKEFDIVLSDISKNLTNDEMVYVPQERYTLMPGDEVTVVIGEK
jgi:hypothetical protein